VSLTVVERPENRLRKTLILLAVVVSAIALVWVTTVFAIRYFGDKTATKLTSHGMKLLGQENFDGPAGAPPNPRWFDFEVGGGGWGNDEQQIYTRDPDNVRLDGTGNLIIEARRGRDRFTSARLITKKNLDMKSGLLEARIKFPAGQGIHSAFWLLGSNIKSMGYPGCGEIDVIEVVNKGGIYHNAIHGPVDEDWNIQWQQSNEGNAASDLSAEFHTFQVRREPGQITVGIDGYPVGVYQKSTIPPEGRWVFDEPMYAILNVAVGGAWPGAVEPSTTFPATMLVDSIRYWQ
jgi:beta-glucanase (GH16 family)